MKCGEYDNEDNTQNTLNNKIYEVSSKKFSKISKRISYQGGARGVMVIIAGYGHGDTSSNPGPD